MDLHRVLMYSRDRCHLCDEARQVVLSVRRSIPFEFEEIDIETSDELVKGFGIRIPVVLVDGEEVFEYRVDRARLEAILSAELAG